MRVLATAAVILLAGLGPQAAAPQPPPAASSPADQLARLTAATVVIKLERMYRGEKIPTQGSGFFVDGRGTIVTNWHVVSPQVEVNLDGIRAETSTATGELSVVIGSGTHEERVVRAKVLTLDRRRDLALIRVQEQSLAWLDIGDKPLKVADPIWVAGFPFGDLLARNAANPELTLTTGRVTSIRHDEAGIEDAIQIDAAVNPGNSGGPLLDSTCRVIGVVNAGISNANLTSFAIPLAKLQQFIENSQVGMSLDPDAVYSRDTALDVRVFPVLLTLDALKCELVLAGGDIPEQRIEVQRQGSEFRGRLPVPPRNPDAEGVSTAYRMTVRLKRGDGTVAIERTHTVPVRESQISQLRSDRDPLDMMRDRNAYGNRTEVTYVPIGLGDEVSTQTQAQKKAALSELAKNVKLKKDAEGKVVLGNNQLSTCRFNLKPANYERLGQERFRNMTQGFDEKECQYLSTRSALQNRTSSPDEPYADRYAREQQYKRFHGAVQTLRGELADLQMRLKEAGLCRCPSGEWNQRNSVVCQPCVDVRAPEP